MIIGYLPGWADDILVQKLENAGCHHIVAEEKTNENPKLRSLVSDLQEGDIFVICEAGHTGTQTDFIQILIEVGLKHAHLVSLAEDIDTLRDSLILNDQAIR